MADLLPVCLAFPPDTKKKPLSTGQYDTQIRKYNKELERQLASPAWTNSDSGNVIEFLDPSVNSIPYMIALNKQATAVTDQKRLQELFSLAINFCHVFDPIQVRYAGEQWSLLVDFVYRGLVQMRSTDTSPITTALLRLDPSAGTFTNLHLQIVRLCVEIGAPSQALPVLDKNIYAYPQNPPKGVPEENLNDQSELSNTFITTRSGFSLKIEPQFVLEYYLLGAHIYIGMRNFTRARLFLEMVILCPSLQHNTSMLQVEAYRKWVLVGLLARGARFPFPKTVEQAVLKNIRNITKPYDALADNFEKRDWRKFQAEVETGAHMWHEDGNLRLVREATTALQRYRVIDLQKTYVALPVARVATHLEIQPSETVRLLNDMIQTGNLKAELSDASGSDTVLRFDNTATATSTADNNDDFETQSRRITALVTYIRDADRRLQLSKEYVEYQKRIKRSGAGDDPADAMDLSYDAPIPNVLGDDDNDDEGEDEDIMAS